MENKFTDNEIINCLNDTVGKEHIGIYCTDKNGNFTAVIKLTDLVDLLNRQKAMIDGLIAGQETLQKALCDKNAEFERLNVELVGMRGACESYKMHYGNAQAEIERLQKHNTDAAFKHYRDGKAEGRREFAELIKQSTTSKSIDELLEEMEEEQVE